MDNVEDLIQQRRLQILVHSCIYYHFDSNIISDRQWDIWARELVELQKQHSEESKTVLWYEAFKDWDASTGAFLPITDEWVIRKARYIMHLFHIPIPKEKKIPSKHKQTIKPKKTAKKKLF